MIYLLSLFTLLFAQGESLILYPGMSASLPASSRQKIVLEKKGLVNVKDLGSNLLIVGKKNGSTHLIMGKKDYQIKVISEKSYGTYQKLLHWQEEKVGPRVHVEEGQIFIRGKIHTFRDWQSLASVMNSNDEFLLQAKIDSSIHEQIKKHLQELCNANNIPFGVFNLHPTWEMSFNASEKEGVSSYKKVFAPLGIKLNQSIHALSALPMIEVNILAAEVRRGELNNFGVNWPPSTQVQVVPRVGLNPADVFVNVELFEQQGWGNVLASPTLLAQSGEEATFHSGGEFPIKTSNQFNASVAWKKYGILLKIKPKADFTGKMSIDIECEVSMVDPSTSIDGVPGLLINRMSSHFNLSETKTIALSGLIKREWGETVQGLPGFQSIPLFSRLFSSSHYRNNQSELMFFVTPRIVK